MLHIYCNSGLIVNSLALIEECTNPAASIVTRSIPATQCEAYGFIFKELVEFIHHVALEKVQAEN